MICDTHLSTKWPVIHIGFCLEWCNGACGELFYVSIQHEYPVFACFGIFFLYFIWLQCMFSMYLVPTVYIILKHYFFVVYLTDCEENFNLLRLPCTLLMQILV